MMFVSISYAKVGTWEYDFADVKGNAWEKDWKVVHGTFNLIDQSLAQTDRSGDDNNAFRAIAQTKWEIADGTIEAKIKHDAQATGASDALLYYRMKDEDNGYASRLQHDNYITIGKISAGKHGHIKFVSTPVNADIWYDVKVELAGNKITVFLNGEEKVSVEDDFSPQGLVGFGMARSTANAYLSWIRVTGEGVTPTAAVSPSGQLTTTWGRLKTNH
jgi:hypothetical protein